MFGLYFSWISIILSPNMQLKGFWMRLAERFGVVYDEGKVATAAGTGHFPGENVGHGAVVSNGFGYVAIVLFGMAYVGGGNHAGKHGYLGFEGSLVGSSKSLQSFFFISSSRSSFFLLTLS